MSPTSLFLLRSTRRTVRKSLLEEVQELEARAVDPGAAVLRDASGRRYIQYATKHHGLSPACVHPVLFVSSTIPLIFASFIL